LDRAAAESSSGLTTPPRASACARSSRDCSDSAEFVRSAAERPSVAVGDERGEVCPDEGFDVEDVAGVADPVVDEEPDADVEGLDADVEGLDVDVDAAGLATCSLSASGRPLGRNWNLLPPHAGHPESISFDPSANTLPQLVHW
jgi:hypothetical protein